MIEISVAVTMGNVSLSRPSHHSRLMDLMDLTLGMCSRVVCCEFGAVRWSGRGSRRKKCTMLNFISNHPFQSLLFIIHSKRQLLLLVSTRVWKKSAFQRSGNVMGYFLCMADHQLLLLTRAGSQAFYVLQPLMTASFAWPM
jgi:hypothetical protein